jgi:hypothetical protein
MVAWRSRVCIGWRLTLLPHFVIHYVVIHRALWFARGCWAVIHAVMIHQTLWHHAHPRHTRHETVIVQRAGRFVGTGGSVLALATGVSTTGVPIALLLRL